MSDQFTGYFWYHWASLWTSHWASLSQLSSLFFEPKFSRLNTNLIDETLMYLMIWPTTLRNLPHICWLPWATLPTTPLYKLTVVTISFLQAVLSWKSSVVRWLSRKHKSVKKYIFWSVFCLNHSKLEVILQNCWISLMTDDFDNLWKSEWVSYKTPQQQNESWSWKPSELDKDETSQYPRATGGSRFIFSSILKLIIPIFKSFKSDCTL